MNLMSAPKETLVKSLQVILHLSFPKLLQLTSRKGCNSQCWELQCKVPSVPGSDQAFIPRATKGEFPLCSWTSTCSYPPAVNLTFPSFTFLSLCFPVPPQVWAAKSELHLINPLLTRLCCSLGCFLFLGRLHPLARPLPELLLTPGWRCSLSPSPSTQTSPSPIPCPVLPLPCPVGATPCPNSVTTPSPHRRDVTPAQPRPSPLGTFSFNETSYSRYK